MGSFNMSCGLSGASISPGDRVMFVPLKNARYPQSLKQIETIFEDFYEPSGLPIYGKYDDYGRIDDGTDITTNGQCFIADIVDKCIERYDGSTILADLPGPELLEYIGFKFSHELEKSERYNLVFTNDELNAKAYSDGTWSHIELNGELNCHIYRFGKVLDYLGIDKNDKKFKLPSNFFNFSKNNTLLEQIRELEKEEILDEKSKISLMVRKTSIELDLKSRRFTDLFTRKMNDNEIKEICKLLILRNIMYCVHKKFFPNICGPQCGEREVEFIVFDESAKFAAKKIKEYDE